MTRKCNVSIIKSAACGPRNFRRSDPTQPNTFSACSRGHFPFPHMHVETLSANWRLQHDLHTRVKSDLCKHVCTLMVLIWRYCDVPPHRQVAVLGKWVFNQLSGLIGLVIRGLRPAQKTDSKLSFTIRNPRLNEKSVIKPSISDANQSPKSRERN